MDFAGSSVQGYRRCRGVRACFRRSQVGVLQTMSGRRGLQDRGHVAIGVRACFWLSGILVRIAIDGIFSSMR